MGKGFQDFLAEYGHDDKISSSDIRAFGDSGGSQEDVASFLDKIENQQDKENKPGAGITIGGNAYTAANKSGNFGDSTTGIDSGGSGGSSDLYSETDINLGAFEAMQGITTGNTDLLNQAGYNSAETIAAINASANTAIASAYSGAQMYGSDTQLEIADLTSGRQLEASNYASDQDRFARENVANIQGAYSLDLQTIVNAGLKDVASIQGEYSTLNTELAGEYGLESDRIRGETARDVASRQKDAQIYGSLMSGFWS